MWDVAVSMWDVITCVWTVTSFMWMDSGNIQAIETTMWTIAMWAVAANVWGFEDG